MTATLKRTAAAFLFAAFVAGATGTRNASAHATLSEDEAAGRAPTHPPEAPPNLRVEGVPGLSHTAAVVSWDEPHTHNVRTVGENGRRPATVRGGVIISRSYRDYWITLRTTPLPSTAGTVDRCVDRSATAPPGCIRRSYSVLAQTVTRRIVTSIPDWPVPPGTLDPPPTTTTYPLRSGTLTMHDLTPATTYYVHVAGPFTRAGKTYAGAGTTTTFTTAANPDGTEPETPGTVAAPGCTYEHRIIGIPGTTANAYTGRILITSKEPNATARIREVDPDNWTVR